MADLTDADRAQDVLVDLRQSIDNLDAVLVHTLAERFRCTTAVGKLKIGRASCKERV